MILEKLPTEIVLKVLLLLTAEDVLTILKMPELGLKAHRHDLAFTIVTSSRDASFNNMSLLKGHDPALTKRLYLSEIPEPEALKVSAVRDIMIICLSTEELVELQQHVLKLQRKCPSYLWVGSDDSRRFSYQANFVIILLVGLGLRVFVSGLDQLSLQYVGPFCHPSLLSTRFVPKISVTNSSLLEYGDTKADIIYGCHGLKRLELGIKTVRSLSMFDMTRHQLSELYVELEDFHIDYEDEEFGDIELKCQELDNVPLSARSIDNHIMFPLTLEKLTLIQLTQMQNLEFPNLKDLELRFFGYGSLFHNVRIPKIESLDINLIAGSLTVSKIKVGSPNRDTFERLSLIDLAAGLPTERWEIGSELHTWTVDDCEWISQSVKELKVNNSYLFYLYSSFARLETLSISFDQPVLDFITSLHLPRLKELNLRIVAYAGIVLPLIEAPTLEILRVSTEDCIQVDKLSKRYPELEELSVRIISSFDGAPEDTQEEFSADWTDLPKLKTVSLQGIDLHGGFLDIQDSVRDVSLSDCFGSIDEDDPYAGNKLYLRSFQLPRSESEGDVFTPMSLDRLHIYSSIYGPNNYSSDDWGSLIIYTPSTTKIQELRVQNCRDVTILDYYDESNVLLPHCELATDDTISFNSL